MKAMRRFAALTGMLLGLAACGALDKPTDFDRHRFSQLLVPYDRPGVMYFDVRFTAEYPQDDAAADAVRMSWLDGWLRQRGVCPAGAEVLQKRAFDYLEDNPARYDERWEISCRAPAP